MGITGLIPFLDKASTKGNINQFSGKTVAIDTYCWLHKGAFSCADKIVMGQPTDAYVKFCMRLVNMLLANRIKPILVFDGRYLPAKAETEVKRRESRDANRRRAAELMKMGKTAEGRTLLRRSVDISHEMALELIKQCQDINVDCIVAPYEADAQLAYLNISGIADVIITEDSDLTLFGCKKIFFKMDSNGYGVLVEQNRLHLAMGVRTEQFDMDKFRHMCILSGCDYLASLPGIGLAKACKFIVRANDTDIVKFLPRLGSYLNMKTLNVTKEYCEGFMRAFITFKHQLVFCPLQRKQVRLHPVSSEITEEQLHHAGKEIDEDLAFQLALGNYHPLTLKKLHDFDPDSRLAQRRKGNSWHQTKQADHPSIWSSNFEVSIKSDEVPKKDDRMKWPNTAGKVAVLNTDSVKRKTSPLKRTHDDMDNDLNKEEILKLYSTESAEKKPINDKGVMQLKEIARNQEENESSPVSSPKRPRNAFLKNDSTETSPCLVRGKRRKMLSYIAVQPTVVDDDIVTKSKYFTPDVENVEPERIIIPETLDEDLPDSQGDEYKENDDKSNILTIPKGINQLLLRSDSGVDMKEDSNDGPCNPEIAENIQRNPDEYSNCQEDLHIPNFDRLMNVACEVDNSKDDSRAPSPDEIFQVDDDNRHINALQSSFFKWSNTKQTDSSIGSNNKSTSSLSKSSGAQNKTRASKRVPIPKKSVPLESQQSLLNMFGFKKKNGTKY